jgi:HTH-type transcriptional regulator/antitoxin HigA
MSNATNPRPFRPVIPGHILRREIEARGWTQKDLADKVGRPYQAINEIIHGRKQITAVTALAFSRVLGTSAEFWMNLETNYRLDLARRQMRGSKKPAA